jgi:hypothetical protein
MSGGGSARWSDGESSFSIHRLNAEVAMKRYLIFGASARSSADF